MHNLKVIGQYFLVFLFVITVKSTAAKTITLSLVGELNQHDCAISTLNQAYHNLNITLKYVRFPSKRSLIESNKGSTDGETARIIGTDKRYTNLVRIPVPICRMHLNLYSIKKLSLEKLTDLYSLNLGIRMGTLATEKVLGKYNPHRVTNNEQLVKMLVKNRLDLISFSSSTAHSIKVKYPSINLKKSELKLPIVFLFHYLNKEHSNLIPKVTEQLKYLESSGYIKSAMEKHESLFNK